MHGSIGGGWQANRHSYHAGGSDGRQDYVLRRSSLVLLVLLVLLEEAMAGEIDTSDFHIRVALTSF